MLRGTTEDPVPREVMRDFALRYGVCIGLLGGAAAHASAGWVPVVVMAVFAALLALGGLARHSWQQANGYDSPRNQKLSP